MTVFFALMSLLAVETTAPQDAAPVKKVVSLNACTDQLLLALADPEQIAGLSYLSVDPMMSTYYEEASAFALLRGSAEEVLGLGPDLVLTGSYSTRETTALLRRLNVEVVEMPPANTFADIRQNLRLIGGAIGQEERAEGLIADMDERLEAVSRDVHAASPLFANYEENGWTTGTGTLLTEIASLAGFRTLGDTLGYYYGQTISLEVLLTAKPDVLDVSDPSRRAPAMASEALKHPALQHLLNNTVQVHIPGHLTVCGTPRTVIAVETLAKTHSTLEGSAP